MQGDAIAIGEGRDGPEGGVIDIEHEGSRAATLDNVLNPAGRIPLVLDYPARRIDHVSNLVRLIIGEIQGADLTVEDRHLFDEIAAWIIDIMVSTTGVRHGGQPSDAVRLGGFVVSVDDIERPVRLIVDVFQPVQGVVGMAGGYAPGIRLGLWGQVFTYSI